MIQFIKMKDVYQKSTDLHLKLKGKIEVKSKRKISNKKDLALVYTPGVAEISRIIAKEQKKVKELTIKSNTVGIVSDGSAILGLGNLGAHAAIPVMEGKALIFKEFANVDAFPICLKNQDTESIIETVKNISPVFGAINLEDISAPRCFEIEKRLKEELDIPVLHDDQHGTSTVVLAGIINAIKIKKLEKKKAKVVINGSGAAGISVANMLLNYGFKNITVCDSLGAIYEGRNSLNEAKEKLAQKTNKNKNPRTLKEVLKSTDIFIGVSAPNLLDRKSIKSMNPNPIIFALANPTPEIMPDEAKAGGAFVVATGRSDFPNQVNNALAFPGIFRGALDNKVKQITIKMLIKAAENLANCVKNPNQDNILPSIFDKSAVKAVSSAIK